MYELFFLVTLAALVVWALRPAKSRLLEAPIVLHEPGRYHATIAPALLSARQFIELIVDVFAGTGDIATQYYQVHESGRSWLLAISYRAGQLYFQAILPTASVDHFQAIARFSGQVMVNIPAAQGTDAQPLNVAVNAAADKLQLSIRALPG